MQIQIDNCVKFVERGDIQQLIVTIKMLSVTLARLINSLDCCPKSNRQNFMTVGSAVVPVSRGMCSNSFGLDPVEDEANLYCIKSVYSDKKFLVKININSKPIMCQLDTGACVSCISDKT